jgi:hypothetical protein
MLSRSVSSVRKKHRTRPAVFCNLDGFFPWQFLNDLAQLDLNFAQAFDLHNSNSFPPINNTLPFLRTELDSCFPIAVRVFSLDHCRIDVKIIAVERRISSGRGMRLFPHLVDGTKENSMAGKLKGTTFSHCDRGRRSDACSCQESARAAAWVCLSCGPM